LDATVKDRTLRSWSVSTPDEDKPPMASEQPNSESSAVLLKNFEFKLPLTWLLATPPAPASKAETSAGPVATRLRVRFSLWHNGLPVDALPVEGWIELHLLSEDELAAQA
jgi:hypothetical protein